MTRHGARFGRRPLAAALLCAAAARASAQEAPRGTRPHYDGRPFSAVPNAAAIRRRFWVPGLDEGFVPQGLTVSGDQILIAAYRSADPEQDRGPARVFRVARDDGRLLGAFGLPARFGHPGGLATDHAHLFVADAGRILALDGPGLSARPRIVAERSVDRGMGPSLLACDGASLWFGPYRREGAPRLYAVPLGRILARDDAPITPADATASLSLPPMAQGATFDPAKRLWISASSGNRPGRLYRMDAGTGAILAAYPAPGGIEDLGHDADGMLWAASEAGSRRWDRWDTFFPVIFEIDPARLRAGA